jgi:hypothetical protein
MANPYATTKFFENVMNRTLRTVLVMAYPPGETRRKKGWPPLL